MLLGLDIRRFITFGVIRGFLYRVHKYAVKTSGGAVDSGPNGRRRGGSGLLLAGPGAASATGSTKTEGMSLMKFLDGMHCFDEICTELQMGEKEILAQLKAYGDVQIIHK